SVEAEDVSRKIIQHFTGNLKDNLPKLQNVFVAHNAPLYFTALYLNLMDIFVLLCKINTIFAFSK
ncbi:hypothetical protein, partial [Butyricicoccus sp.]|uniref:hypothetical protein n=1 Tax=Butyricicoccus sp. TaxID=2049021 RepID=UPI003AAC235B